MYYINVLQYGFLKQLFKVQILLCFFSSNLSNFEKEGMIILILHDGFTTLNVKQKFEKVKKSKSNECVLNINWNK